LAPVPDAADATLQAANASPISAILKTLGIRPWYIMTSFKTRLGSEGVALRGGKIPPAHWMLCVHHLAVPLPFQIISQ
jgi:hypothetical protein